MLLENDKGTEPEAETLLENDTLASRKSWDAKLFVILVLAVTNVVTIIIVAMAGFRSSEGIVQPQGTIPKTGRS